MAAAIFLLICLQSALTATYRIVSDRVGYRMSERIRNAIHCHLLFVPFDHFLRHERGDLLNALATHSFSVAAAYNSLVRIAVSAGAIVVFAMFLLAASWQIALMALAGFRVLTAARQLARVSRVLGEKMMTVNLDLSTLMLRRRCRGCAPCAALQPKRDSTSAFKQCRADRPTPPWASHSYIICWLP